MLFRQYLKMFSDFKYIFLFFIITWSEYNAEVIKICRIYNIYMCDISKNSALNITEFRFYNPEKSNSVIYVEAPVSRDLAIDPKLEIDVVKCKNLENPDTCEKFTTLKPSNFCNFMFMKGMLWSDFVANIRPIPECRLKKNHYIMQNATVNPDLFSVFPITGFIWKIGLKFMEGNEFATVCVIAEIKKVTV